MKLSVLQGALVHAIIIGVFVLAISVPIIFLMHAHFELGEPPHVGLISLCVGVIAVLVGASLLGVWWGLMRGERASGASAAFLGLMWGVLLSLGLSISYSRQIGSIASRRANLLAQQNRQRIETQSHETVEQSRAGHASKEATIKALQLSDKAVDATISGTAKLPAMSLLVWTILVPPLLCAFECRRARD